MQTPQKDPHLTQNKFKISKQYYDEHSDTYESSQKNIDSDNNNKLNSSNPAFKNSIGFFPKKIYLEEPEEDEITPKRKYSIEEKLFIKDFVPQLKPIEIHLVPSKLNLNKKGFRDLKCNKNNKILLMLNNYYISAPNSNDEEDSDVYTSSKENLPNIGNMNEIITKKTSIKDTRKDLQRMKSGNIPKVFSKNNFPQCQKIKDEIGFINEFNMDSEEMYDNDSDFSLGNNAPKGEDKKKGENKQDNKFNSLTILDVLQNKFNNENNEE